MGTLGTGLNMTTWASPPGYQTLENLIDFLLGPGSPGMICTDFTRRLVLSRIKGTVWMQVSGVMCYPTFLSVGNLEAMLATMPKAQIRLNSIYLLSIISPL